MGENKKFALLPKTKDKTMKRYYFYFATIKNGLISKFNSCVGMPKTFLANDRKKAWDKVQNHLRSYDFSMATKETKKIVIKDEVFALLTAQERKTI